MVADLVVKLQHRQMGLRNDEIFVVAMIADQREAFGAARQVVARRDDYVVNADGLADQEFRAGRLAVGIAGIARVKLPAAVGPEAVDTVEIERRRAEIFDRGGIGFLVAERGEIERDVVIDELAEIGEPRRDFGVVAGRVARVGVLHRVGKFLQRTVVDGERFEVRKHSSEHSGIVMPGKRIKKLSVRLAATFAMARLDIHLCCHHFLQSDVGRRGVPVCRNVRSLKVQENPIDTPQKGSVSKTQSQTVTNRSAVPAVYFSSCVSSFTDWMRCRTLCAARRWCRSKRRHRDPAPATPPDTRSVSRFAFHVEARGARHRFAAASNWIGPSSAIRAAAGQ